MAIALKGEERGVALRGALHRLMTEPTIVPADYFLLMNVNRNTGYKNLASGDVEAIRVGNQIRVKSVPLRRKLELTVQSYEQAAA